MRKATKAKALGQIGSWSLPHKDNVFDVENAIDVTARLEAYGYCLKLTPATDQFVCEYLPIR
jgi:hypothetical protein